MAKKKESPAATIPTPLSTDDLTLPAGMMLVLEKEYHQLIDASKVLITQKQELLQHNAEYKSDLRTMIECLANLGPLVGNGGFTPASIMKLINNREKLEAGLKPMFAVIEKYTASTTQPAP